MNVVKENDGVDERRVCSMKMLNGVTSSLRVESVGSFTAQQASGVKVWRSARLSNTFAKSALQRNLAAQHHTRFILVRILVRNLLYCLITH